MTTFIQQGQDMHAWACDLFPIMRSLSGPGVRQTLEYFRDLLPGMEIHSVDSGTQCFDWTVPDEWTFRAAWIEDEAGKRVIDAANHTLHVVNYSEPVDCWLTLDELQPHLYSAPETPDWIPYVTSYYRRHWGFCLTHNQRQALKPGRYRVVIDTDLQPGAINYGELVLPGRETAEILISTYVCHPSMANNELSGPVLAAALGRWLAGRDRRFTYRILFLVETMGAVAYLSRHWQHMKAHTRAGFVLSCVGDERGYSFLPSRRGDTLADRAARRALRDVAGEDWQSYSFLQRGSDERQYCSPLIDLPVALMMRSKFGEYPEYHTSGDDLSLITPKGLAESFGLYTHALDLLEKNKKLRATVPCEPQLGKRGLYPTISTRDSYLQAQTMVDVLAYADGSLDIIGLADVLGQKASTVLSICDTLLEHGLLEVVED